MKKLKSNDSNEVRKRINKYAYLLIAFHQGVSYISQLAVQYFFKDELKVEPHSLAQINSIVHLPWAMKPILGLITDFLPICGYRRKVYLILCGLINLLCWMYMTFYTNTATLACFIILIVNLTLSFCSVLGEAIVVELSQLETDDQDSKAKDLVSMFFFARTVGELISSYLKGLFVDIMPLRTIFFIGSFIPILLVIAGCMLIEKKVSEKEQVHPDKNDLNLDTSKRYIDNKDEASNEKQMVIIEGNEKKDYGTLEEKKEEDPRVPSENSLIKSLINFICQRYILIPIMFIIIFKATPSYNDPLFYFVTNELKINATALGKISFCSTIAILIAIMIYKAYLKTFNFKHMIIIGTVTSFFISLLSFLLVLRINTKIGISDFWLLLFTNSFLSLVGELVLLPILALACVLCPKNLEGTVYSVFMSSLNLGGILSNFNGGILTSVLDISSKDYSNLHWLILISKVSTLAPLPILFCIEDKYFNPEVNKEIIKEDDKNSLVENKSIKQ